jgi:hypothetical protein
VITTFGAEAFPSLVTLNVNMSVSPGITRVLSTDLATTGSAILIAGVALDEPLPGVCVFVRVLGAVAVFVAEPVGVAVEVLVAVDADVFVGVLLGALVDVSVTVLVGVFVLI